jgi:tetratricopeptide (TPR) repeat protein
LPFGGNQRKCRHFLGVNTVANNEQQTQQQQPPQTQAPVEKPEFSLEQFEPDVFWKEHGRKVTWGIAIALALGAIAYLYQLQAAQKAEAASLRLAEAKTPEALQVLIKENITPEITAQATLQLADLQFQQSQYAEAAASYQKFLTAYPQHTLADAALLGLAAVLEAQGKYEEARQKYNTLADKKRSYTAIAAKVGAARCSELLGQLKQARQQYEELLPAVQGGPWQNTVFIRLTVLGRNLPKEAPALPAGTVPLSLVPAPR